MAEVQYSDGEVLFNKKDSATNFYVLKSGEIELFDPDTNKKLAILEKGASFVFCEIKVSVHIPKIAISAEFCFNLAPERCRCNEIGYPRGFSY